MALSREQKEAAIADLTDLLNSSKMTVIAQYTGTGVAQLQDLRKQAKEAGTTVKVAKNRLVKQALSSIETFKDTDVSMLEGQLIYAFNSEDEVAPAQSLHEFAKKNPQIQFVGAISETGEIMDGEQVKQLAQLPSKDQLRGQLVGTIAAPLSGFVNVLSGNMRGLVNVINARSEQLEG